MLNGNVAYTKEYLNYRATFDFVFNDKFKTEVRNKQFHNDSHTLKITLYHADSGETSSYPVGASMTKVYNADGQKVAEFRNIYHVGFYTVIEHSNGNHYLLFSIDLYGYSVLDLTSYNMFHYIPVESFRGEKETFIWTEVYYCKSNNILAVDGCYWACPSSTLFVDFKNPEALPYEVIGSTYELADEINIDTDATPVRWNDDGTIVLACSVTEDEKLIEKTFNIQCLRR